jgi:hypothetical protein
MNQNTEQEKVLRLFTLLIALFEKFVERVDRDVMHPFLEGDFDSATENLSKIGKRITVDKLMSLVLKNFADLMALRINITKHYGEANIETEKVSLDLEKKFTKMLKEIGKLSNQGSNKK